ncbi:hypothetical protein PWJ43_32600 [Streptomyces sp. BE230]|nr:hypothetical protein [Streptomyces sp. BE230]
MGQPSDLAGILTVSVDGDLFEDCPALAVGYVCEPDRIEIRHVKPLRSAEFAVDAVQDRVRPSFAGPAAEAISGREVSDAWQRVTRWLQRNAAGAYAALRAGANGPVLAALEQELGVQVPVGLRVLWPPAAGDDGVNGAGCLPGNGALMTRDAVADFYDRSHAGGPVAAPDRLITHHEWAAAGSGA